MESVVKVKVQGSGIFDGQKVPVMVILSEADKANIAKMQPGEQMYCCFPTGTANEPLMEFMQVPGEHKISD